MRKKKPLGFDVHCRSEPPINNNNNHLIEKSYLYFSHSIKILDDAFIKSFYIDKSDECIIKKHKIILENKDYINSLFEKWKILINYHSEKSNIFILI